MSNGRLPKNFPTRKLKKIIKDKGFELENTDGSHANYSKNGCPYVITIPLHPTVSIGVLSNTLKIMDIDRDEFFEIIRKKKKQRIRKREK